jgi:hypothetical protein
MEWADVHTKLHENPSANSKLSDGKQTCRYIKVYKCK